MPAAQGGESNSVRDGGLEVRKHGVRLDALDQMRAELSSACQPEGRPEEELEASDGCVKGYLARFDPGAGEEKASVMADQDESEIAVVQEEIAHAIRSGLGQRGRQRGGIVR